jgi:hypothetical protein
MATTNRDWQRIWQVVADAAAEIEKIARETSRSNQAFQNDETVPVPDDRLAYSISETAKLFGRSHTYIRKCIALGQMKPINQPGRTLISRKEIDRFMGTR